MTPERTQGGEGAAQCLRVGLLLMISVAAIFSAAGKVTAQSAFNCRGLEMHAAMPAVEGKDGLFIAIRPELQAHHNLADRTIAQIGALSRALEARGTTLVLLPVPPRAMVLSHRLPAMAAHLGYDADAATAVHIDMIRRLTRAGVSVADARAGLRAIALAGEDPFFGVDPRPTSQGARVLAQSVGSVLAQSPGLNDIRRTTYTTTAGEQVTIPSAMRSKLQSACQDELPALHTTRFSTAQSNVSSFGTTLQPSAAANDNHLVLLGTEITQTHELNLAGFMSEATGLESRGYGVHGGGAFAAMSSYLTSADFRAAPPRVLVWEWPVTAPLGNHGDQPMIELLIAASADRNCRNDLSLSRSPAGDALRAALGSLGKKAGQVTLMLDTGMTAQPFVRFNFTGEDGLVRTRSIYRHPDQVLTGRFYLPLSGFTAADLQHVEIKTPGAFGAHPRLAACF